MSSTFRIEGGALVAAALRALGNDKEINRAAREALLVAAEPIRAKAEAGAPDDPTTAGALKSSIKKKARKASFYRATVDVGIDKSVDPPKIVGRKTGRGTYRDPGVAGVAPIIEFGRDGVAAVAFMRNAMDAEFPATGQRIGDALWPAIEKAAKRIAKRAGR